MVPGKYTIPSKLSNSGNVEGSRTLKLFTSLNSSFELN
jgi:hypothetical protein